MAPSILSSIPGLLIGGKSLVALIPFYQKCLTPTWAPNEKIEAELMVRRAAGLLPMDEEDDGS